jgi:hypothetical protein
VFGVCYLVATLSLLVNPALTRMERRSAPTGGHTRDVRASTQRKPIGDLVAARAQVPVIGRCSTSSTPPIWHVLELWQGSPQGCHQCNCRYWAGISTGIRRIRHLVAEQETVRFPPSASATAVGVLTAPNETPLSRRKLGLGWTPGEVLFGTLSDPQVARTYHERPQREPPRVQKHSPSGQFAWPLDQRPPPIPRAVSDPFVMRKHPVAMPL